nr:MAG TPA: hypothetical protein [Caudoviricetes sp.]
MQCNVSLNRYILEIIFKMRLQTTPFFNGFTHLISFNSYIS